MTEKINREAVFREVEDAAERLRGLSRETPLEFSSALSETGKCRVYLKCENLQLTGSFKVRGAANKMLSLDRTLAGRGMVTASSGNHGNAFACISKRFGYPGIVFLPENATPVKVDALRSTGCDIEFFGDDCVEAESFARAFARKKKMTFVSPYNDIKIIGGQGTVGYEIHHQMEVLQPGAGIDSVLVPVGGGGLISGISGYLKSVNPAVEIIGCQPERSAVMYESLRAGKIIEIPSASTLSDGTAGGIESGAITFDLCRELVDRFVLVSEKEIADAISLIISRHHQLVEGSAVLSVAAFLCQKEKFQNRRVVLILSGSRIGVDQLREIFCGDVQ